MNLYEIKRAYEDAVTNAMCYAEENNGELSEEIEKELTKLELDMSEKIENTALYIKNLSALSESIKEEESKLNKRRKTLEKRAENLKHWLLSNMGTDRFTTAKVDISVRVNESIDVYVPVENLPSLYQRVKTTVEPDKLAIKNALKNGIVVDGVCILHTESLVIR